MTDTLALMAAGFMHAISPINLLAMLASTIVGMVGGGGIGNLAVQYGYYRYETGIMIFTIVFLVILVQLVQHLGDYLAKKFSH